MTSRSRIAALSRGRYFFFVCGSGFDGLSGFDESPDFGCGCVAGLSLSGFAGLPSLP
jgi:hypothetical protein